MFEWIFSPEAWITLLILSTLEIVLGIDNIIFIAILVNKLPKHQQDRGRIFGLSLAMLTRIALLTSLFWMMQLTRPLLAFEKIEFSGRDLILIFGGFFLLYKSVCEIYEQTQPQTHHQPTNTKNTFWGVLIQIAILDLVFSLDSVITAVGMAQNLGIMISAIILSILVMLFASKGIVHFINAHPSIKTLALAFLLMIGIFLILEGFGIHISKSYIYSAMGFSFIVEMLNLYIRKQQKHSNSH